MMTRRELMALAAVPVARVFPRASAPAISLAVVQQKDSTSASPIDSDGRRLEGVDLVRELEGPFTRPRLVNRGTTSLRVKDVVVLEVDLHVPAATRLYGEGFQMLTQTGGALGSPVDFSQYTDAKHYRIPVAEGTHAFYGLLTLTPPAEDSRMFAFTSCRRFSGRFDIHAQNAEQYRLRSVVDTEGLEIRPGETWVLEELMVTTGPRRGSLLEDLSARIASHHPRRAAHKPPTGWCSWYCFGPRVTAEQVLDNLDAIATSFPSLKHVQIDDGYQPAMGDWLETGAAFGGNVRAVVDQIRRRGFEPAIWVAPFVAEATSHVFKAHPDWFISDSTGAPLRSDRVTFGGWRRGPWYALDGTHPDAQQHLQRLFQTMRSEWGCTYFKLDANFWGAMHGGRFHDPLATRVEAYRRGMEAIRRGAGDGFLLGCNHPIWPSLGLIDGSRSSNDIKRSWDRIATTARQNLSRNWQNGRLWWNDPDAVVLDGELTDAECRFHATAIYATGGMVLSGDDLTRLPPGRAAMLRKLLPPTGVAATFDDQSLTVGTVQLPGARMMCLFNWDDASRTLSIPIGEGSMVVDHWTSESLGRRSDVLSIEMPPRSARLLKVTA